MKNISYLIAFLVLLSFTSCEEMFTTVREIDIPEHDKKLSINTVLSGDSIRMVISHSKQIDDDSPYEGIDAEVSLLESGSEILSFEYNNTDNQHIIAYKKLNTTIKEGTEYTIIVDSKKFGTAKSSEIAPKSPAVKELNFDETLIQGQYDEYYKFDFVIEDEKGIDNYYLIKFSMKGLSNRSYLYTSTKDPQINSIYIQDDLSDNYYFSGSSFLVSDKSFDGINRKLSFEIEEPYTGSNVKKYKIIMEVQAVTKSYYNFIISRQQAIDSNENPFAEPVAVVGNIENGYGVFNIFSSKKYVIYEK